MRLTLQWNSLLESTDRGQDLFREHMDHSLVFQDSINFLENLIMYLHSKYSPHPLQMYSWTKRLEAFIFWYIILLFLRKI